MNATDAPHVGHARAVTGKACPMCDDGPCREPWLLGEIPPDYPLLPKEIVDAMQPSIKPEMAALPSAEARAKRLAEDRARRLSEDRAHRPGEDRAS